MASVSVVIPIYKENPSKSELASFHRVIKILKKYPIVLIAPKHLDLKAYESSSINQVKIKRLHSRHFEDIASYNRLMLSPWFYLGLLRYKYILIYQLDCWVFRDELENWCTKGYSYIGAPWDADPKIDKELDLMFNHGSWVKKKVVQLLKKKDINTSIGNGGLSLRNTRKFFIAALFLHTIIREWESNEDYFWGLYCANLVPTFKVPTRSEALQFSIEQNGSEIVKSRKNLPFGCHAWEKYDKPFWEKLIF